MTTVCIEQIKHLAAVAEELIVRGYPIYTIYADENKMHVHLPDGMPEPTAMESSNIPDGAHYEHRVGTYNGVSITWLVERQKEAA